MQSYTKEEVKESLLAEFKGDELKASTFMKYLLQDKYDNFYEKCTEETFRRLSSELARIERKYPNPMSEEEIFSYLVNFRTIIFQGSPMAGIGNNFLNLSLSNCIVVASPEDTISSIFDVAKDMANLFKRRCGVGIDISTLRWDGATVNNSAKTSSGAWSFADLYSFTGRLIGQNGRRAALMITMDIRHPDALKFARAKIDHNKIRAANLSLKVNNDFFRAVEKGTKFIQQWPIDATEPIFKQEVDARELFNEIAELATATGDPGLLLFDNIKKYLPADIYPNFETISTNPCGELPLSADDGCRLISHNLTSYVEHPFTKKARFNHHKLYKDTIIQQRLADDLVDLEIEKLTHLLEIADKDDERQKINNLLQSCISGRRTGIGTQGLADTFIMMGMTYGDDASIKLTSKIYRDRMNASYESSAVLANERGPFPFYDKQLEANHPFLKRLKKSVREKIARYGRRNIANLTNAPTGSIAIVADTSAGIDPNFAFYMTRKRRKSHNEVPSEKDFVDTVGERYTLHNITAPVVKKWVEATGGDPEDLPDYFIKANDVDIENRLAVQAAAQKYIDHSISNTFNLPKGTTSETVQQIYLSAWRHDLKGVTVFVDGCKEAILSHKNETSLVQKEAIARPGILDCNIHTVIVKKEKWTIIVGLLGGKPYEVFGGLSKAIELPQKITNGKIQKITYKTKPAAYDLELDNGLKIKDIGSVFDNDLYEVHTRMVSLGLRHGAKPSFIAEQLQKDRSDSDLTSFSKVLARVLKTYIDDGTKVTSEKLCRECGNENLIYHDGCILCTLCGYSKCG